MTKLESYQKKKILHIDMDAFFASVEQRDNPELKGKPIAVGGGGNRGVTTTASYEARAFGVKSAMPGFKAKQLCPHLIFVPPRFDVYREVSLQIRDIFRRYTDVIEPLSFDEAFLDVTSNKINEPIATYIAKKVQQDIFKETNLTCSAGVSYCKFLAKVASDIRKPNGITIIKPHQAEAFIAELPIERFFGVGKVTARKMQSLGIFNGSDLRKWSNIDLAKSFGKSGLFFYNIARGIDDREVQAHSIRKSLAVERTLDEDLELLEDVLYELNRVTDLLYRRLKKAENFGRTISLKLKTHDFRVINRSVSKDYYVRDKEEIRAIAKALLETNFDTFEKLRLIGLTASNLEREHQSKNDPQLKLEF